MVILQLKIPHIFSIDVFKNSTYLDGVSISSFQIWSRNVRVVSKSKATVPFVQGAPPKSSENRPRGLRAISGIWHTVYWKVHLISWPVLGGDLELI